MSNHHQRLLKAVQIQDELSLKSLIAEDNININFQEAALDPSLLLWAAYYTNDNIFRLLLRAGADPNQKTCLILDDQSQRSYGSVLCAAAGEGAVEIVQLLLAEAEVNIHKAGYDPWDDERTGWTALEWAAYNGELECCVVLISAEPIPERSEFLNKALVNEHYHILKWCQENKIRLNYGNDLKPLHLSCLLNKVDSAVIVLDSGIDVNERSAVKQYSPLGLHLLNDEYNKDLFERLIEAGAMVTPNDYELYITKQSNAIVYARRLKRLGRKLESRTGFAAAIDAYKIAKKLVLYSGEGREHKLYRSILDDLGHSYFKLKKFELAKETYQEEVAIFEAQSIHDDNYLLSMISLSSSLYENKEYTAALNQLKKYLVQAERLGKDESEDVEIVKNNIIDISEITGRYGEAITFLSADLLKTGIKGEYKEELYYRKSLRLSKLYLSVKNKDTARKYLYESLVGLEKLGTPLDQNFLSGWEKLCEIEVDGDAVKRHCQQYLHLTAELFDESHVKYLRALHFVGEMEMKFGRYERALDYFDKCQALSDQHLHPSGITIPLLFSFSTAYAYGLKELDRAIETAELAISTIESLPTHKQSGFISILNTGYFNISQYYKKKGNTKKFVDAQRKYFNQNQVELLATAASLSPIERQQFIYKRYQDVSSTLNSLLSKNSDDIECLQFAAHLSLFYKDLPYSINNAVLRQAHRNQNFDYDQFTYNALKLDLEAFGPRSNIKYGLMDYDSLHKALWTKLPTYELRKNDIDYFCLKPAQISTLLCRGEYAVDIVAYTDNNTSESNVRYGAIVYSVDRAINFIKLGLENNFQLWQSKFEDVPDDYQSYQRNLLSINRFTEEIYLEYFKPVLDFVENAACIYIAYDGWLNFVADQMVLIKRTDVKLHRLNSLREITIFKNKAETALESKSSIGLVGALNYNDEPAHAGNPSEKGNYFERSYFRKIKVDLVPWGNLNGTEVELYKIENIIGMECHLVRYSRHLVNKSWFLSNDCRQHNILHIATHGFNFALPDVSLNHSIVTPDEDTRKLVISFKELDGKAANNFEAYRSQNADRSIFNSKTTLPDARKSGIILSRGNNVWLGQTEDSLNEGILTAHEVALMDFSGVDLVVLSACNSALGKHTNLNGVDNLPNAFRAAGVKFVISALWPVSDIETINFMSIFYTRLVAGDTIVEAFSETQIMCSAQNISHETWGSFLLSS